jgi:hypothetical protein
LRDLTRWPIPGTVSAVSTVFTSFWIATKLTELVLLPHAVDEVTRRETLVVCAGELLSGAVKSTTETGTNGQETRNEGRDKILAGTGGDDGIHGTGHGGTVVGSKHEDHLEELGGVVGMPA